MVLLSSDLEKTGRSQTIIQTQRNNSVTQELAFFDGSFVFRCGFLSGGEFRFCVHFGESRRASAATEVNVVFAYCGSFGSFVGDFVAIDRAGPDIEQSDFLDAGFGGRFLGFGRSGKDGDAAHERKGCE